MSAGEWVIILILVACVVLPGGLAFIGWAIVRLCNGGRDE